MWVRNVCCSRGLRVVGNDDDDDDDDDKEDFKAAAAAACIDIDARALGGGDAMKNLVSGVREICVLECGSDEISRGDSWSQKYSINDTDTSYFGCIFSIVTRIYAPSSASASDEEILSKSATINGTEQWNACTFTKLLLSTIRRSDDSKSLTSIEAYG